MLSTTLQTDAGRAKAWLWPWFWKMHAFSASVGCWMMKFVSHFSALFWNVHFLVSWNEYPLHFYFFSLSVMCWCFPLPKPQAWYVSFTWFFKNWYFSVMVQRNVLVMFLDICIIKLLFNHSSLFLFHVSSGNLPPYTVLLSTIMTYIFLCLLLASLYF